MCATEEQFLRLNSEASINLNLEYATLCWFSGSLLVPKYNLQQVSPLIIPRLPADLGHAAPDVRVHQDDQEGHEDEVGVAEDIFQQEKFKPIQMIKTKPIQQKSDDKLTKNLKMTPSARQRFARYVPMERLARTKTRQKCRLLFDLSTGGLLIRSRLMAW